MTLRILSVFCILSFTTALADDFARTISVSGTGQVHAMPDRATVRMSIMSRATELEAAQQEAARVTAAVLALTEDLDIDANKVDTTGATVRPDYRWNRETETQELRGYVADRQLVVVLDDLEKLGQLVEGAVGAGVNNVFPAALGNSRSRELHREALALAAEDARANAAVLAESLGAKLGDPISITDGSTPAAPPVPMQMRMMADNMQAAPAETYNTGEQSIAANVAVVFSLGD